MSKRLHRTVFALSLGLLGMGVAHAQLVIEDGQPHHPSPAPTASPQPSPQPSAHQPAAGLVIVDGYDTPAHGAVPAPAVPAPAVPAPAVPAPVATPAPAAISPSPATPMRVTVPPTASVVEVGPRPARIGSPKGWANGMPLMDALHQVVPADYSVRAEKVNTSKPVSWSGDRPWNDVLGTLAHNANLHIAILWSSKTVTVVPGDQPALTVIPGTHSTVTPAAIVSATPVSTTPVFVTRPLPVAAPVVQTWTLDPSKTLRENVEAWVKQAGWNKLVWEGVDYQIYGAASFSGRFDDPDGPLARLIDGYAQSKQPLLVRLTSMDRVVHVFNKNYQPVEIEAVSAATLAPDILTDSGVKNIDAQAAQQGASMKPITINDHSVRH